MLFRQMGRTTKAQQAAMRKALDTALSYTATHHGNSRWSELRRCPRGHRLRYTDGIRLREQPDYFALGQIVHSGLGYAALGEIEGFDWDLQHVWDEIDKRELFPPDVVVEGKRLLRAYFGYWGRENAGYGRSTKLLEVEHFVATRKIGGKRYTGRVDLLAEMKLKGSKSYRLVIVDHKTRRSMPKESNAELALGWSTNPQFLGLAYCVREIEGETPAFCVNVITKTQIPQFRRVTWQYEDGELDEWAEQHRKSLAMLDHDFMNYNQCDPPIGTRCWAFGWCHGSEEDRKKLYLAPERKKRR